VTKRVYDIAIVGAGMAGASLAAAIGSRARIVVLEAEDTPGYHATGRSAAFWSETYGGPAIQPLTTASGPILKAGGHLAPLGSLHIGRAEDAGAIDAFLTEFADSDVTLDRVDPASFVPGLRPEWALAVQEASCAYIDVAALHAASIATARRTGADFVSDAAFMGATRASGVWRIETKAGNFHACTLVNAAGAWADDVAIRAGVRPLGLQAYRRTMVQLRTDPGAPAGLPHIADIAGRFYFKPEPGGRLWLSPHDETASQPCDAAPEEIDVAIAIERFEHVVDWRVAAVERSWAGLRTFASDRLPIYGYDVDVPSFFWCAGQGGFGIQTAPAAALLATGLLLGTSADQTVAAIDPARYSPHRF
jgi:D-arginine dehydrogenase